MIQKRSNRKRKMTGNDNNSIDSNDIHLRLYYLWCRLISVGKPGYLLGFAFIVHLLFTFLSLLYQFFKFNAHFSCSIIFFKAGLNLLINNHFFNCLLLFNLYFSSLLNSKHTFFSIVIIKTGGLKLLF